MYVQDVGHCHGSDLPACPLLGAAGKQYTRREQFDCVGQFMHDVDALIAKADDLTAAVRRFGTAIVCSLAQGFSLLPITDALAKELVVYQPGAKDVLTKPLRYLSDELQVLAAEISHHTPVAYISTYYFGGQGGQDAVVWDKGSVRFSPSTKGYSQGWPNSPISQALRMIGVVAEEGQDEFDSLGLGKHRKTHQWAEAGK